MLNSLVVMKSTSTSKKAMNKSSTNKSSRQVRAVLRYAYPLAALILLLPILSTGLQDLSLGAWNWYAVLIQSGYLAAYALIAPALLLLFMGRPLSTWLRGLCNVLVVAMVIALAWVAVGGLQDLIGMQCQGFFGVVTSCTERQYVSLFIWTTYPYVLLSLIGLTLLSAAKGWFDYFYYDDRGKV